MSVSQLNKLPKLCSYAEVSLFQVCNRRVGQTTKQLSSLLEIMRSTRSGPVQVEETNISLSVLLSVPAPPGVV